MPRRCEEWEISSTSQHSHRQLSLGTLKSRQRNLPEIRYFEQSPAPGLGPALRFTYAGRCGHMPPSRGWLSPATESCGHVGKKQHGFQWEEVTAKQCWAQDVVLRWSRPLGRQVLGPRVLDTSFVDHQQESCKGLTSWFRDAMIQGHLNNNFARKNFQGIESVTVPKEGSPGLSRLLSVLKHLTSSWEALGFLWLWVTL